MSSVFEDRCSVVDVRKGEGANNGAGVVWSGAS